MENLPSYFSDRIVEEGFRKGYDLSKKITGKNY